MRTALRLLLIALLATPAFAANVIIINNDLGMSGFKDPTLATPTGGNTGTTRGQQRLIAVQAAVDEWGKVLKSDVDIVVDAAWQTSTCSATSGTLAFASTNEWMFNFEGAPQQNILYPVALANKFAKRDLSPSNADILIRFNPAVDNATCLGTVSWYYGLDGNAGNNIDLIATAMHELAHGLGFVGNINGSSGRLFQGTMPAIFDTHILDNSTGLRWDQMTESQRAVSALNDQNVVWDGLSTRLGARNLNVKFPTLQITAPASLTRKFGFGRTSGWGAPITAAGVTAEVVTPLDVVEPTLVDDNGVTQIGKATDGCSSYTNLADVRGKFALIDRGYCTFVAKAQRAADAGAVGVIIANNVDMTMPPMGGDVNLTIPVVSVSKLDGALIRTGNSVTMNFAIDTTGDVRLYMPVDFTGGSSVYHWDELADPDLLMEPRINSGLPHTGDVTVNQLADIGWASSDSTPTPDPKPSGRRILKRGSQ